MISERLNTVRLELRPFAPADAGAVFEYWSSDPGWAQFNDSVPDEFTKADADEFVAELIARDREVQPSWAVVLDEKVVGLVSFKFELNHGIAVIGYGIHGAIRGQGLAGEAVRTAIDAAFLTYSGLQKIRAHTDAENAASIRVLAKLGFLREGILRCNQFAREEYLDETVYGLLRNEWPNS